MITFNDRSDYESLCLCTDLPLSLVSHSLQCGPVTTPSPLPCPVELFPPPTSCTAGGYRECSQCISLLSLSLSVWPLSPRASPYSHPQTHVMTLRVTHLGRGHIPYSAPRISLTRSALWHTRFILRRLV